MFRAGLTLPTGDDDIAGIIANTSLSAGRLTDNITVLPKTTALRLAASGLHTRDKLFFRADAGVDAALSTPKYVSVPPTLRLNLDAGYLADKTAIMAEIAVLGNMGKVGEDNDRFVGTASLSARRRIQGVDAFGAIVVPLLGEFQQLSAVATAGMRL